MTTIIRNRWVILISVAIFGTFADWFTKCIAQLKLTYGTAVNIIGDNVQLLLVYNKGALFGLDPGKFIHGFPVNPFFVVFTLAAITFLLIYFRTMKPRDILAQAGLIIILPGALGNLFDRVLHAEKGVVDFIKIGISQELYWPIFNVADIYVTCGVVLLLISFVIDELRTKTVRKSRDDAPVRTGVIKSEVNRGPNI